MAIVVIAAASASLGEIPEVHFSPFEGVTDEYPIWVSGRVAFDEAGHLRDEYFHPDWAYALERALVKSPDYDSDGCLLYGEVYPTWVGQPPEETLSSTLEEASLVLRVSIRESDDGFFGGEPGQMLRVETTQVILGGENAALGSSYLVFVGKGVLRVGTHRVCKRDARYPDTDFDVGGELFVVVGGQGVGADSATRLIWPDRQNGIFAIDQRGRVLAPKNLVVDVAWSDLDSGITSRNEVVLSSSRIFADAIESYLDTREQKRSQ